MLGRDRSARFYDAAMNYAQTLWLHGFPAKSLLLINRALSCNLPDVSLTHRPTDPPAHSAAPYQAKAWILINRPPDKFIGNPRRHYQHLATRMVEPHKQLRTWRAWACWYIAKQLLREDEHPPDFEQVREELIVKPRRFEIADKLRALSPADDLAAWEAALEWAQPWSLRPPAVLSAPASIRIIGADEVAKVRALAHEIWPQVYPGIITKEQINYMLADRYAHRTLEREIIERGVVYALIESGGEGIGYIAFEEVRQDSSLILHKLYLKPDLHGQGIGALALRWLETAARARQLTRIVLRVNKRNQPAIRAYVREGFTFDHDLVTDIGGGFVMDDHVMVKVLALPCF